MTQQPEEVLFFGRVFKIRIKICPYIVAAYNVWICVGAIKARNECVVIRYDKEGDRLSQTGHAVGGSHHSVFLRERATWMSNYSILSNDY